MGYVDFQFYLQTLSHNAIRREFVSLKHQVEVLKTDGNLDTTSLEIIATAIHQMWSLCKEHHIVEDNHFFPWVQKRLHFKNVFVSEHASLIKEEKDLESLLASPE